MSAAVPEVYSLLIPLAQGRLLVPRACIAEVIGYQPPVPIESAPPWYLGLANWNARALPVASFEAACGQPLPAVGARARIVVFHALLGRIESGYFGIVSQGFPQLVRLSNDVLHADSSRSFPERAPVLCQVHMMHETPLLPDLERLEAMIDAETVVPEPS